MMSTQDDCPPPHPPRGNLLLRSPGAGEPGDRYDSPITVPLGLDPDRAVSPADRHTSTPRAALDPRESAAPRHEQRAPPDFQAAARLRDSVGYKRATREMWSPETMHYELELAAADAGARQLGTWYLDRQRMFVAIWNPTDGFSRVNVLVLAYLLGSDVIPWLTDRAAGMTPGPPFNPHLHLAHVGTCIMVDGKYDVSKHWIPPRLVTMGQALRRLALGLRIRVPGTEITELMRSVAVCHTQCGGNGEIRETARRTDRPWLTRPTTARLACIGDPERGSIVNSIPLMLPRIPTFEVSLDLPWNADRGVSGTPESARNALRMASHDPSGCAWEPQGYSTASGRPIRHNTPVGHASPGSPIPTVEASVFSFPLSAHALRQVRCMFQQDTLTSWAHPQKVVLEFYDSHGSVIVLAGDYMSPPARDQLHPGVGMPEVIASTTFSRRGYTPWLPSSDEHAGDIYISFHEHGPSPEPEPGGHEHIRYREDSRFFRMIRQTTPHQMATGMETGPPHLRRVEVVIQARPRFPPLSLNPTINPMRWSLLWTIVRLRVSSFLIGRSVDNWIRDLQHPSHESCSSTLGRAPNTSLLRGGIYKYIDPVGLVFRAGSTSSHWEALATRRAQLELTRIMASIPPQMGTHASYRVLRSMRHECVQYMMDRYHDELTGSLSDSPDEDLNLLPYGARLDQSHLPRNASRLLSSPHIFFDTPIHEPEDNPFYVLLSRLDVDGTVVDHVTIHSHSRDIAHLSSDRSRLGPSETQHESSDGSSDELGTDDEEMFDRRSETTALRRAARARIINHRRMGRRTDTAFGEYATYSPLIRWEPHGYTRDGLPYTATHADIAQRASEYVDTARCINTPVPAMAIPLSHAELSRVKEVLLYAPPPQRVLLSITDPDERQRPIQLLAGDRLDPPCSDQRGIRCPRRSPVHVDPAPSDACDIHGPTRRVAATFHARRGYPTPNGTRPTVAGHIYITHPTRRTRLADFDGATHARRSRHYDPENLDFSFWPLFGASNDADDAVRIDPGDDLSQMYPRRCEVLIQQVMHPLVHQGHSLMTPSGSSDHDPTHPGNILS